MRKAAVGSLIVLASFLGGCGGGLAATGGARGERATVATAAVSDDAFAGAVLDLLRTEPGSAERAQRLSGVEQRQMARAAARFQAHAPDRGLAAVTGALYLLRTGELRADTLGPEARAALGPAAREVSEQGDEGKARAFYEILLRLTPDAKEKHDAQAHLDAISAWLRDVQTQMGPVEAAGELQRAAVSRALLEPSQAAIDDARAQTMTWIERALDVGHRAAPPMGNERDETFRALRTGPGTLMALRLREADAAGALQDLDRIDPSRARSQLQKVLKDASEDGDPEAWLDLWRRLRVPPRGEDEEEEEASFDAPEFLRAAAFTVALEAFRLDPSAPEAAGAAASVLQDYGMAEASPAVLVAAARAHADPRTLGGALGMVLHAMQIEVQAEDLAAARRTYRAAGPLLALAESAKGKVTPSPADVRAMMGEIELRDGHVDVAKKLLDSAVQGDRPGAVLSTLARIDRFEGRDADALARLRQALAAPDVAKDPSTHAELLLASSDIALERGNAADARTSLDGALRELARARTQGDPGDRARAERVLSRVLDRFGAADAASKALDRAFDAAPHDKGEAAQTLGQMVARALVRGDVVAAREGLRRALALELDDEDLVYIGLWTRLTEKQTKNRTDGAADRLFASIPDDGRWIGRLAAFGRGTLKPEALLASAKTPAQRTEALFYTAMDRRAAGDATAATNGLQAALKAGGIDLLEVAIAREILHGARGQVGGPVPEVGLP